MTAEIISWSISTKKNVVDPAGVKPATSWSLVRLASNWATEASILLICPVAKEPVLCNYMFYNIGRFHKRTKKILIILRECANWFGSSECASIRKHRYAEIYIYELRKTSSDISTTLIQGFNFTNSRFQLHEFTISTSRIHDFNFTNSTSQIQLNEYTNSTSRIHEFRFTNSTSRIQLHEFTISTSWIHDFNFTNSISWIREFSTSRIHEFSFTNSQIQLHEFNFTNSASRIHEFTFTNSTSQI